MKPCVFTSIPKSGTHLVLHILGLDDLSYTRYEETVAMEPAGFSHSIHRMRRYKNGTRQGHIAWSYGWGGEKRPIIFLYRHPGDIIVSWYHYIFDHDYSSFPTLPRCHENYLDYTDILAYVIRNLRDVMIPFLPWLEKADFVLRYEDLLEKPEDVLPPVGDALGVKDMDGFIALASHRGGKSFRKGVTGEWKKELTGEHLDLFLDNYQDIAERMGYSLDY